MNNEWISVHSDFRPTTIWFYVIKQAFYDGPIMGQCNLLITKLFSLQNCYFVTRQSSQVISWLESSNHFGHQFWSKMKINGKYIFQNGNCQNAAIGDRLYKPLQADELLTQWSSQSFFFKSFSNQILMAVLEIQQRNAFK